MKRALLIGMAISLFAVGPANASGSSSVELNEAPNNTPVSTELLVSLPNQEPTKQVLACFPQPCHRCYDFINACKRDCNGDVQCQIDCEDINDCQFCCY